MARPKKDEEKRRPVHLGFRVTREVREALEAVAKKRKVPLSDIAHEALECYVLGREKKSA